MQELAFVVFNGTEHTEIISVRVQPNTEALVKEVLHTMGGYDEQQATFAAAGLCQNPYGALKNPEQVTEYTAGDLYIRAVVTDRGSITTYHEQLITRG